MSKPDDHADDDNVAAAPCHLIFGFASKRLPFTTKSVERSNFQLCRCVNF
jgi:hypothetical protein